MSSDMRTSLLDALGRYDVPPGPERVNFTFAFAAGWNAAATEARADSAVPSSHVSGMDGPSVPSDRAGGEGVQAPPAATTQPCGECGGEGWVDDTQDRHGFVPRVKCPRCNGARFDPDGTDDCGEYGHAEGACGNSECVQPPDGTTERDAARYRWLKMSSPAGFQYEIMRTSWTKWDEAIDAAMSEAAEPSMSTTSPPENSGTDERKPVCTVTEVSISGHPMQVEWFDVPVPAGTYLYAIEGGAKP